MNLLFDSFWRAIVYCVHPRVMVLSILPLLLMLGLTLGLGYFYWDAALAWVGAGLDASTLIGSITGWMQSIGLGGVKSVLVPLLVIFAVTPLIVVVSLLMVALMMTPALTALVAEKRFPALERKHGGSMLASLTWSLLSTLLALVALVVSIPLWFVPPLILILPPLIWGWLTYRVMAFDAMAEHASSEERREIFRQHRLSLLGIGVFSGFLGATPGLIWASGVMLPAAFLILVPLAIWIYTLVFAMSSLWFAHYCLAALQVFRAVAAAAAPPVDALDVIDITSVALPHEPNNNPRAS